MSYSVPPFVSLWPMRHQAQNENAKKQGRHPCTQPGRVFPANFHSLLLRMCLRTNNQLSAALFA
jgi:hypothetical protein